MNLIFIILLYFKWTTTRNTFRLLLQDNKFKNKFKELLLQEVSHYKYLAKWKLGKEAINMKLKKSLRFSKTSSNSFKGFQKRTQFYLTMSSLLSFFQDFTLSLQVYGDIWLHIISLRHNHFSFSTNFTILTMS